MIVRIWHTQVHPDRLTEYEEFAQNISLPMFRQQEGCLGVLFFRVENMCQVLTLWDNMVSIQKLSQSPTYAQVVNRLESTGMLWGKQPISIYKTHGGFIDVANLSTLLETSST